jgi:hypothetical protein
MYKDGCSSIDYTLHLSDTDMYLLSNSAFFSDRNKIRHYSSSAFVKIVRHLYRILAHIWYHHRKLFDSLEYRYRIAERLTLYCKKFKTIYDLGEYCIKI